MNKSLLMAITACAAMAMTSCSSEDLTGGATQANETPISFSTYLGRNVESRAGEATLATIQTSGFGVFAFYTGSKDFPTDNTATPNFMNNQKVTYQTNAWTYSPLKYWPNNNDDKVSFFAYAPYDESKTWSSNKIAYTVDEDVTKQVDLLFCEGQTNKTKQSVNGKITFNFKHALSRIGFSVAYAADQVEEGGTLDANTTININKVVLRKKNATDDAGVFYTGGNLTLTAANADAAWADQTGAQAFTLATDNFNSTTLSSTTKKIAQLNKDDSYVMIIPQNTEFEVYVEYTVTTEDTSLTNKKSEIVNKITTPVSTIDFKAGTSYTLNLVLGMTSVKVEAEASDWTAGTTTTVNAPANTQN